MSLLWLELRNINSGARDFSSSRIGTTVLHVSVLCFLVQKVEM